MRLFIDMRLTENTNLPLSLPYLPVRNLANITKLKIHIFLEPP